MNQGRMIRLPVHRVRELNLVLRAKYHLEARLHHQQDVRLEDIAHLVERSVDEVREILGLAEPVSSLDTPLPSDANTSLLDVVADIAAEAPDVHVEQQEMTHMVRRWIDAMPIRQRMVILRRFGLDHGAPATLDEIAIELGVTRERVRQIQQDGLHRLKQVIAARGVGKDALL
jgi:RNA polymerase nonessential primary-like sigma factor